MFSLPLPRLASRLAAVALAVAFGAPSAFAGDQDFTLVNRTGVEIHQLYIASSAQQDWEEDVLGADVLPVGESVDITFPVDETVELWDMKVVDGEGNDLQWGQLNLKAISKVTLFYKNGDGWAETE
jgi:hypothetical protein